jgi:TGF-beta propeptide
VEHFKDQDISCVEMTQPVIPTSGGILSINNRNMAIFNPRSAKIQTNFPMKPSGFILIPVVLTLTLLATIAFMLSRQSAINAGGVVREHQPDEARYVAEAGLNHAQWQANLANCTGYSDLTDIPLGQHTYSTIIAPTSGSPVSINATAYHDQGASYTISRDLIKVYQPAKPPLILQPDAAAGKDTYIYEWKSTWNYGLSSDLWADDLFADSTAISLLEFDLTGVPADAYILSATLELYQNSPSSKAGSVSLHRITSAWVEGIKTGGNGAPNWTQSDTAISWTTAGGDYDAKAVATTTIGLGIRDWYRWGVGTLIQDWVDGKYPNLGFMLVPAPGVGAYFYSSDYVADPSLRPKLTVTYTCECGVVCGTVPAKTGYYRDEFALPVCDPAIDYTRSDGSLDWSTTAWTEVGELGDVTDACAGSIKVRQDGAASNYSARLVTSGTSLKRSADLTGFATAWLSFDSRKVMDDATDQVDVAISANGGASWTVLESFTGVATDTSYQQKSYDISAYISANTLVSFNAVNFVTIGGGTHQFHIDNVQIGDPPEPKLQGYFDHFKQRDCVAADYSGSDGSLDWTAYSWTENTETDGSCAGMLQIAEDHAVADATSGSYRLILDQRGNQIDRQVDLSAFTTAYLSFDFRQYNYPTTSDYFRVRISKNGGFNWSVLEQFDGIVSDTEYRSVTYDISAYTASNTVIRFEVAGINNIQTVYIDNVLVSETPGGGMPPPPLTSPATLNPSGDNYITSGTSTNEGTNTLLKLGRTGGPGRDMYSLLLFDVSAIPEGSLINSATLRLYASNRVGSDSFNLNVHQMTQNWTELGSNWNNADVSTVWTAGGGGTYSATVIDSIPAASTGWYEWNIAPLVQEWVENPPLSANQGIELIHTAVAKSNGLGFDSKEGANKPELVIDFTAP